MLGLDIKNPHNADEIRKECIWKNKFIKIDNDSLFNKELYNSGLICIDDLLNDRGTFLTYDELTTKYGPSLKKY